MYRIKRSDVLSLSCKLCWGGGGPSLPKVNACHVMPHMAFKFIEGSLDFAENEIKINMQLKF